MTRPGDPAYLKALAHPLRQRLLFELGERAATISQLAVILDARKGNVAHHLKVLRDADLVHIAETRHVRGGTEHYYRRTVARVVLDGNPAPATAALLQAVTAELARSPTEPILILRHLRLTEDQAARLATTLTALVDETPDAGVPQPRFGLLVSLYRTPADDFPGVPA